jgi:flagellar biosynthesis/type III secretory pathway protein FliH
VEAPVKWYEHKPSDEARSFRFGDASQECTPVNFAELGARIKRASSPMPAVAANADVDAMADVDAIAAEAAAAEAAAAERVPQAAEHEVAGAAATEVERVGELERELQERIEQLETAHWERFADAFEAHRADTLKQAASWIREVTMAVTQHIVGEAVREDAAAGVAAVERALEVLNGLGHATVHVHPRAVRAVERALYDVRGMDSDAVQVLPDVSVTYGNARIATNGGGAEVDVAERTKLLVDAALESVTRRRITASQAAAAPIPAESTPELRRTGTGEPV